MLVEGKSSSKVICLRTQRWGEYTSTYFNTFSDAHGIMRQLIDASYSQQYRVLEIENTSILNKVKFLLSEKNMLNKF